MSKGEGGALQGGQGPPPQFSGLALTMMLSNPESGSSEDARVHLQNGDLVCSLHRIGTSISEGEVGTVVGTAADCHDDRSQRVLVDFGGDGRCLHVHPDELQLQRPEHSAAHSQSEDPSHLGGFQPSETCLCHAHALLCWLTDLAL